MEYIFIMSYKYLYQDVCFEFYSYGNQYFLITKNYNLHDNQSYPYIDEFKIINNTIDWDMSYDLSDDCKEYIEKILKLQTFA
jgi:hypothetical protein